MCEPKYAPLLRWKQSEWLALRDLHSEDADRVLPIIEIVPKMLADGKLPTVPKQLSRCWNGRRLIVDGAPPMASATTQSQEVYEMLRDRLAEISAKVIPVIKPSHLEGARKAALEVADKYGGGVAFRVGPGELGALESLLRVSGVQPQDVDLVIDFGAVDAADNRYALAASALIRRSEWRSVIFLGGSFPQYLTGLAVGQHLLPRHEWRAWDKSGASAIAPTFLFGDYTIQYVGQSEPVNFPNFSASIRYAALNDWVVMRGEGVRNAGGAGYAQWPANAMMLRERTEYRGPAFSKGDAYIELMGTNPPTNGGPGSWLKAGINHHMTLACRQAANLL